MIDAMESAFKWGMIGLLALGAGGGCCVGGGAVALASWMRWIG